MKPTIGRIVIMNLNADQAEKLGGNHGQVVFKEGEVKKLSSPQQTPAIIVAVWGETCVNLKAIGDCEAQGLWITSAQKGDAEGQWNFPVIVKE